MIVEKIKEIIREYLRDHLVIIPIYMPGTDTLQITFMLEGVCINSSVVCIKPIPPLSQVT